MGSSTAIGVELGASLGERGHGLGEHGLDEGCSGLGEGVGVGLEWGEESILCQGQGLSKGFEAGGIRDGKGERMVGGWEGTKPRAMEVCVRWTLAWVWGAAHWPPGQGRKWE
jgi:hypothetical protein